MDPELLAADLELDLELVAADPNSWRRISSWIMEADPDKSWRRIPMSSWRRIPTSTWRRIPSS
jgi:hypothetical protein